MEKEIQWNIIIKTIAKDLQSLEEDFVNNSGDFVIPKKDIVAVMRMENSHDSCCSEVK